MQPGTLFGDRFEIERLAGAGGMGQVFRARDRSTGETVALKVLRSDARGEAVRFAREASVLAELGHPAIVRYVAHGITAGGDLYLAMEWLDGEDLGTRLARGPLDVKEALGLVTRLAQGLAEAHGRSIIHRDVKPSNIFLPAGRLDDAKLVDFGIVRVVQEDAQHTQVGTVIGTPEYMSPEQARGERSVDARTDVFALGCVLYEALAGRAAFGAPDAEEPRAPGENLLAVLANVLFEEPPELGRVRPDIPEGLSMLVTCMLSKRPELRPPDGRGVLLALRAVSSVAAAPPSTPRLSGTELRRLFVVVARPCGVAAGVDAGCRTIVDHRAAFEGLAAPHEAHIEQLVDGSVVASMSADGSATDGAARAARCALALRRLLPEAAVALATGRGLVAGRLPVGEVIDRAAALLRAGWPGSRAWPHTAIRLCEATAGLLAQGFAVDRDADGLWLRAEIASERPRTLLGRPSPCVGRDRELAMLSGSFTACVKDSQARAVVVTAPPGMGKSRLRYEFLQQLGGGGEPVQVWFAAAEKLSAGSPFFLIGQILRRGAGIHDGESGEVRRRRLRARVARHLPATDVDRVASFLGELAGAAFPDRENLLLSAARRDPQLMGDQTRVAWEDYLRAECRAQPVMVVLEDLHWGDLPSVGHLDWALARLSEEPLFVLALARPEVDEAFPDLWKDRNREDLPIGQLPRRACERLVRHALGERASPETSARLVSLAAGNAYYLEELIRAVADGRSQLPETVLAMAQSRYEALAAQARQLLRAGAILGEVFWRGAVFHLVPQFDGSEGDHWLRWLVERELLEQRPQGRFENETEYALRHGFLREAAYAALTDDDRCRGHGLAAQWLERAGESDPMTLAEHLDRAGEQTRAVAWYRLAAEHAIEGGDFAAAQARAMRALACGAAGEDREALKLVEIEALKWQGHLGAMVARAAEIAAELPRGSPAWLRAASDLSADDSHLADIESALTALDVDAENIGAFLMCAARVMTRSYVRLRKNEVARLFEKTEVLAEQAAEDPVQQAWLDQARAFHMGAHGRIDEALRLIAQARSLFLRAGDRRNAFAQAVDEGFCLLELGRYQAARDLLVEALPEMEALGLHRLLPQAQVVLATAEMRLGNHDRAMALAEGATAALAREPRPHFNLSRSLQVQSNTARLRGDLDQAEKIGREALRRTEQLGIRFFDVRPVLAQALLAMNRPAEALQLVSQSIPRIVLSDCEGGPVAQRLARAEALQALGRSAEATAAITEARAWVLETAAAIVDSTLRRSFLENVPDVSRILTLAHQWGAAVPADR